ncbi:MAG: hypothetical protein NVS2B12_01350 [Ktedonobacteraceae bacterium]
MARELPVEEYVTPTAHEESAILHAPIADGWLFLSPLQQVYQPRLAFYNALSVLIRHLMRIEHLMNVNDTHLRNAISKTLKNALNGLPIYILKDSIEVRLR